MVRGLQAGRHWSNSKHVRVGFRSPSGITGGTPGKAKEQGSLDFSGTVRLVSLNLSVGIPNHFDRGCEPFVRDIL